MRIFSIILINLFILKTDVVIAKPICGEYKIQVYVSENAKGKEVFANPKSVSSTKIILTVPISQEYWGRVVELQLVFKKPCLGACEISSYKILSAVSPFKKLRIFNHDHVGLIKKMKCEKSF